MGDRVANLARAVAAIAAQCGPVQKASAIYETAAWGMERQPHFLNQALLVYTQQEPVALLETILMIERSMGRIRNEKYGPRLIDIDILLFGPSVIDQPGLKVPHPRLQDRRFALQCLSDIAADVVHPVFGQTIGHLLEACTDRLEVHKFS